MDNTGATVVTHNMFNEIMATQSTRTTSTSSLQYEISNYMDNRCVSEWWRVGRCSGSDSTHLITFSKGSPPTHRLVFTCPSLILFFTSVSLSHTSSLFPLSCFLLPSLPLSPSPPCKQHIRQHLPCLSTSIRLVASIKALHEHSPSARVWTSSVVCIKETNLLCATPWCETRKFMYSDRNSWNVGGKLWHESSVFAWY